MTNETVVMNEITAADASPRVRQIFTEFLKLGCTAFGGPAIIAHIRELTVDRQGWIDNESFKDVISPSLR